MIFFPNIDPVFVRIGPLAIHWYGLLYIISFSTAGILLKYRQKWTPNLAHLSIMDILVYVAFGVVLGGRLGYILFYAPWDWWFDPIQMIAVWRGGMSFHGGLIGALLSLFWMSKRFKCAFSELADFIVPVVPLGLAFGRIGNFINGELWGRVTNVPWGMIFPGGGSLPRHPSQWYESCLEGWLLFAFLWWFSSSPRKPMKVSGSFLVLYGLIRFFLEFFREPDPQCGFILWGWLTQGQLLSLPMIIAGLILLFYRR
jgi:phosphatidylglycerol:prolipoprotein diacylglycerol transferase